MRDGIKLTDDGGQLAEPPTFIIEAARLQAIQSPCAKSKRGVVLFSEEQVMDYLRGEFCASPMHSLAVARGFNGPPRGFGCRGDTACREACPKLCLHAEQRAILEYVGVDVLDYLDLVHVKVVDGVVVAGGPPSCLECSRLVVEVGLRGVWLFELPTVMEANAAGVTRGDDPRHEKLARWHYYSGVAFHRATLRVLGLIDHAIDQLAAGGAV